MTTRPYDLAVIGAGIGGLALACRAAARGRRVLLAEKSERPGGVVRSRGEQGYLLEEGPNSFVNRPATVPGFLEEIGLAPRLQSTPMAENDRYVWHGGRLRKVPGPPAVLWADCLGPLDKLRVLRGVFRKLPPPEGDFALGAYLRPRIGDRAVDLLVKPALAGVYAADADRMGLEAVLPRLHAAALRQPSIYRALRDMEPAPEGKAPRPRLLLSFPGGLDELPRSALDYFRKQGGDWRPGVAPRIDGCDGEGHQQVRLDGESFAARQIVLATPADAAAALLADQAPEAARELAALPYAALRVLHAGLPESALAESRPGFGFLAARDQGIQALGCLWSDRIFPGRVPEAHRLLTAFFGGEMHPEALDWSDAELERRFRADLECAMGLEPGRDFEFFRVTRWERALPVFPVGQAERLRRIEDALPPGLSLLGNYQGGISLGDRIARGLRLAGKLEA